MNLHQAANLTAAGAVGGGFWGMLIGMIFLNPLVGAAVGGAGHRRPTKQIPSSSFSGWGGIFFAEGACLHGGRPALLTGCLKIDYIPTKLQLCGLLSRAGCPLGKTFITGNPVWFCAARAAVNHSVSRCRPAASRRPSSSARPNAPSKRTVPESWPRWASTPWRPWCVRPDS